MLWNYEDCQLKSLVLDSVISGRNTSKQIFYAAQYKGSMHSLYAELCMLRKRGYLTQTKTNGYSVYGLTAKGQKHAKDPFMFINSRRKRADEFVNTLLSETKDPKFTEAHNRLCSRCGKDNPINIIRPVHPEVENANPQTNYDKASPTNSNFDLDSIFKTDSIMDSKPVVSGSDQYLQIIAEQNKRIKGLEADCVNKDIITENLIERFKRGNSGVNAIPQNAVIKRVDHYIDPTTGTEYSPYELDPIYIAQQKKQRKVQELNYTNWHNKLLTLILSYYQKRNLNAHFFRVWSTLFPIYVIDPLFGRTIEIGDNAFMVREKKLNHFKGKLSDNQIDNAGFYIVRMTEDRIYVFCKGMKEPKEMRF